MQITQLEKGEVSLAFSDNCGYFFYFNPKMSYYSLSELLHGSRWGVHGDCGQQGISGVGKYRAHTGHQAASHTGEMKDFGEIRNFFWNNLKGSPAAKSWTQPCLLTSNLCKMPWYLHRWPQWFCAEKKVTISQMQLMVEELQERFHGDGNLQKAVQ